MTKVIYEDWNPSPASKTAVDQANEIIEDYRAQGYTLTLRQLYYQFVARGLLHENTERQYKNLGNLINKARKAGLVSWTAIEDGNRSLDRYHFEEDPRRVIKDLQYQISFDRWARQEYYVEVWVEKDALSGVISRPCDRLYVPHLACKGYLSASEAWRAGQRFKRAVEAGLKPVMIHLGDHDPEGLDMTRDNRQRLQMFSHWEDVQVERIALNMDQVEEHSPPPNFAKASSTRFETYVRQYGETCWELDALEPSVLDELITRTINQYIDQDVWVEVENEEESARNIFKKLEDNWSEVRSFVEEMS